MRTEPWLVGDDLWDKKGWGCYTTKSCYWEVTESFLPFMAEWQVSFYPSRVDLLLWRDWRFFHWLYFPLGHVSCKLLAIGACHLPLQGLNHVLPQLLTFNTSWWSSGWRAEMRHSVLQESWQDRSSDSYIFSGANFMSPSLVSPHIYKSTKILHGDNCFLWLAEASQDQKKFHTHQKSA